MTSNVQVLFRVRPLINQEKEFAWSVDNNKIEILPSYIEQHKAQEFEFTSIYDEEATNEQVFETSIQPLVCRLVEGFNCTVIAYGQSSSGKTSTMFKGPGQQRGITSLIVQELFKLTENTQFRVKCQFVEIYNENMTDLLSPQKKQPLIREENQQIILTNIEEPRITNEEELQKLIKAGNERRTVSETSLNEFSSRSHSILRLVLEQGDQLNLPTKKGFKMTKQTSFTLVDLAGSERLQKTNAEGHKLKEANSINQSLMTLGLVINQLATKQAFVNYRDSKLTRLLQNSLGGNAITFIIGCISPASIHIEESLSTMRFCQRAMKVSNKTKVLISESGEQKLKQEQLMVQNRGLKQRIHELEQQMNLNQSQCLSSSNITSVNDDIDFNEISMLLEAEAPKQHVQIQTEEIQIIMQDVEELNEKEAQILALKLEQAELQKKFEENLAKQQNQHQNELIVIQTQIQQQLEQQKIQNQQQIDDLLTQMDQLLEKPEVESFAQQKDPSIIQLEDKDTSINQKQQDNQIQTSIYQKSMHLQTDEVSQHNKSTNIDDCTVNIQTSQIIQEDKGVNNSQLNLLNHSLQTSVIQNIDKSMIHKQLNTSNTVQTSLIQNEDKQNNINIEQTSNCNQTSQVVKEDKSINDSLLNNVNQSLQTSIQQNMNADKSMIHNINSSNAMQTSQIQQYNKSINIELNNQSNANQTSAILYSDKSVLQNKNMSINMQTSQIQHQEQCVQKSQMNNSEKSLQLTQIQNTTNCQQTSFNQQSNFQQMSVLQQQEFQLQTDQNDKSIGLNPRSISIADKSMNAMQQKYNQSVGRTTVFQSQCDLIQNGISPIKHIKNEAKFLLNIHNSPQQQVQTSQQTNHGQQTASSYSSDDNEAETVYNQLKNKISTSVKQSPLKQVHFYQSDSESQSQDNPLQEAASGDLKETAYYNLGETKGSKYQISQNMEDESDDLTKSVQLSQTIGLTQNIYSYGRWNCFFLFTM
ncbi:Kinesin-7 [Hexamita inflata]|uniref:Kinesin-like protein n=1 Tax=Hexamita inflata TaxID=28002 RepID=A0AA86NSA5_9EUKA|nr:Kinesin-7 [Hexamita inflata]